MWWSEYQAWHRRNKPRRVYVEATMTDILPAPTPPAITRDQLWPELEMAAGEWRKHYHRCPEGQRCRRDGLAWIDTLLDEWLAADPTPQPR